MHKPEFNYVFCTFKKHLRSTIKLLLLNFRLFLRCNESWVMKIGSSFILFLFFLGAEAMAQIESMPVSGRASSGWSYTSKNIQSSFANQAGLSEIRGFSAAGYAEQTFLLPDFYNVGLAVALPAGDFSAMGINFNSYGIEEFRQNRIGLAYGMKMGPDFSLGAQIDWYQMSIDNYGQANQLSFRLGFIYDLFSDFSVGIHIANPLGLEIHENSPLPSVFNIDLEWRISDQLVVGGGLVKDIDYDIGFKAAIHYHIHPSVTVILGTITEPSSVSFGVLFNLSEWQIQSAAAYHQPLGFSPSAGFSYQKNQ